MPDVAALTETERTTLIETRRDLHAHPEMAYEEHRTAGVVEERLRAAGYEVRTGVGGTGVVAEIGEGERMILLRADMDALPIQEANEVPYRSQVPQVMHACGHDGHTAILLTVAERLKASPPVGGRVRLCFQPAEEGRCGAVAMMKDGVLEGVEAVFGLHLWQGLDLGLVGAPAGPMMAAVDRFEVTLTGEGGHGAMPEQTRDPVVAAAQVVSALQSIVSRGVSPLDSCVVTVGRLQAGDSWNVIPGKAVLEGTLRSYSREVHASLPERFTRVVEGVAGAMGCEAEIALERIGPPTINTEAEAALVRACAAEVVGAEGALAHGEGVQTMAGEDFSYFLEERPGCFFFVGSRNAAKGLIHPHHSPRFDFDEDALGIGVRVLEGVARSYWSRGRDA